MRPRESAAGFVLVSVLLLICVASVLVTAAAISARGNRADAALELRSVQARAAADAGLVWIITALETGDDPVVRGMLESRMPVRWPFEGREIVVSLVPESGKVDLNAGDPDLVRNLIEAVVEDPLVARRVIARLAQLRGRRQYAETVRGLLDPEDRIGSRARRFEAVFTVSTNLLGFDPKAAPPVVLRSLPGLSAGEARMMEEAGSSGRFEDLSTVILRYGRLLAASKPIYRARAEATIGGVRVRREALVVHNSTTHVVSIGFWRDVVQP